MTHMRQQYGADYYSGANITVSMGPCILTQAFGIQYDKRQNVTPIYGYNSQHYDALSKGNIIVNGTLILNFISPRYLTVTVQRFHQIMSSWRYMQLGQDPDSIRDYLTSTPEAANLYAAINRHLNIPTDIFPLGTDESPNTPGTTAYEINSPDDPFTVSPEQVFQPAQYQPTFGTLLDEFFESDAAVSGLQRIFWGDNADYLASSTDRQRRAPQRHAIEKQYSISDLARTDDHPLDMAASNTGPDRLGHPIDGTQGLDITITYGNPYESQVTNTTFQYDHSSSRIIKGVRFYGENTTMTANSEPVMEIYPFLARNVYALTAQQSVRQSE